MAGVLKNTGEHANKITSQELRHIQKYWDRFKDSVNFYKDGQKVGTPW